VGVVEEAVQERADGGDVAEQLPPVLHGAIRGQQSAHPFVPPHDQLEEILGGGGGEPAHGEIVDDEEGDGGELRQPLAAGPGEGFGCRPRHVEWDDVQVGRVKGTGVAPKFSRTPGRIWRGSVPVGHDNDLVYRNLLGLSDQELDDLRRRHVV